jgi:hypothetical protein
LISFLVVVNVMGIAFGVDWHFPVSGRVKFGS